MARKEAPVIFLILLISFTCAQLDREEEPIPEGKPINHNTTSTTSTTTHITTHPSTTTPKITTHSTTTPKSTTHSTTHPSTTTPKSTTHSTTHPSTTHPSTTTPKSTTHSTTHPSTTTPKSTTHSTTHPSTTTPKTTSTTRTSTTPSSTSTKAPTVAPNTTTTVAPITSTNAPTPVPSPEYRKWSYPNTSESCVIVQLAMQLNLTYKSLDGKPTNALYNVPVNGTSVATGSCGKDNQSITVQWGQKSLMMFQFKLKNSQYLLSEIVLSINATNVFKHAAANQIIQLYHATDEFATPESMSYLCNKIQTIGFTSTVDGKDVVADASISHVQFEAFHKQKNDKFSAARDCEPIDTPDIVPIAVGCALAGLVIVVLIAYLVGRRRAQARGYLSM